MPAPAALPGPATTSSTFAAPARPADAVLYAGFWRRFTAAAVDLVVVVPFSHAITYALGSDPLEPLDWSLEYWRIQWLLMALSWLYSALLESSRWQGTLGQQLLGVRVFSLSGRRIGFGRATVRHFAQILSLATFGIGYLMIAFSARKQALHDRVAGCLLVRPVPRTVEFTPTPPAGLPRGAFGSPGS